MTSVRKEFKKILIHERKKKEQSYDKRIYPKLVLNRLNIMGNSTSIYTHWTLSSKFLKKLPTHM
jgi:hypothetical protein